MKINTHILVAIFFLSSLLVAAQSPTPTPVPIAEGPDDVVRISTNLIQVDATITDKKGNPITDIRSDEVEIYENGVKQAIAGFSFISNVRIEDGEQKKPENKEGIVLPPPRLRPDQVRRAMALVVDDLSLSFESASHVRHTLRKFVEEQMQEGDMVAIVRTGGGMGALQQFTSDKRMLLRAIEKVKFNLNGRGMAGAFAAIRPPLNPTSGPVAAARGNVNEEADNEYDEYRRALYSSGTLGALNYIIRGMSELPGRKSVILFSDGISLSTGRFVDSHIVDSIRILADLANRASVVVYPVDARGLLAPGLMAEDNTYTMLAEEVNEELDNRRDGLFDSQQGLRFLAAQTGGFAIMNQNNLSGGVGKILRDQSYYLIAYTPSGETFEAASRRFNKLEIKVKREGARVRYRSGFFGVSEEKLSAGKLTGDSALLNALVSPFGINDIDVRLNAFFSSTTPKENFVRGYLHIDAADLSFKPEADGGYTTQFDLVAYSFGDNGIVTDQLGNTHTMTFTPQGYENVKAKGVVYTFLFPVKRSGGYQMRVAVRDRANDKVGSASQFVDVPNIKKKRLTLSGALMESMPYELFQKIVADPAAYETIKKLTDPMTDTAVKEFYPGTVIRVGFDIYNARLNNGRHDLTTRIRIYSEGKVIHESAERPVEVGPQDNSKAVSATVSFRLGNEMQRGEYIIQVIVNDRLKKGKYSTANQFIIFDVVDRPGT